jgi:hypothetical protein
MLSARLGRPLKWGTVPAGEGVDRKGLGRRGFCRHDGCACDAGGGHATTDHCLAGRRRAADRWDRRWWPTRPTPRLSRRTQRAALGARCAGSRAAPPALDETDSTLSHPLLAANVDNARLALVPLGAGAARQVIAFLRPETGLRPSRNRTVATSPRCSRTTHPARRSAPGVPCRSLVGFCRRPTITPTVQPPWPRRPYRTSQRRTTRRRSGPW